MVNLDIEKAIWSEMNGNTQGHMRTRQRIADATSGELATSTPPGEALTEVKYPHDPT
jgi:hypothetical protein